MNSHASAGETPAVLRGGAPLDTARGAVIFLHGRGASAESMLPLAEALSLADLTYYFPQARGGSWYPFSFLAPVEQNEPFLSQSLQSLSQLAAAIVGAGMPAEKVLLAGFSQGACLALEWAARNPARYGGVAALSGGLIGPPDANLHHPGSLLGTPVFLGCSDVDAHIPKKRVLESEAALRGMGAAVTARLYPGMGHTVNEDELNVLRQMAAAL